MKGRGQSGGSRGEGPTALWLIRIAIIFRLFIFPFLFLWRNISSRQVEDGKRPPAGAGPGARLLGSLLEMASSFDTHSIAIAISRSRFAAAISKHAEIRQSTPHQEERGSQKLCRIHRDRPLVSLPDGMTKRYGFRRIVSLYPLPTNSCRAMEL
ncbi:hypothetical protein GW17_00029467 [Ensete ventricosum]|nr:hypothetical protein GW17_00029467 [Ensete ventricosum]